MSLFSKTQISKTQIGLSAAVLVAILGGTGSAHAQTQTFSFVGALPGSQGVYVSSDGGKTYEDAYTGRYHATLNGAPINIFCVDISHDIHNGDTYAANTQYHITDAAGPLSGSYYKGGLASAITTNDLGSVTVTAPQAAARASEVAWLADNYLNASAFTGVTDTNSVDNLTAVNLSIWDIVRDGGDGISSGQVQATNLNSSLSGLVSYYEGLAGGETTYQSATATWIQAPESASGGHMQDYVYEKPATPGVQPVPEPGVPTMLLCLGLVVGGVALRRKRQMSAASRA